MPSRSGHDRRLGAVRSHLARGSASSSHRTPLRLGVIGLDSSHGVGFASDLSSPSSPHQHATVVACVECGTGYKGGPVIESMSGNLPKHAEQMAAFGAPAVDTVASLLDQVDGVFLTSWDGRVRLDQAMEVLRRRRPMFMDKPIAASLAEVLAIYTIARALDVPVFSSSSLRWLPGCVSAKAAGVSPGGGGIIGADITSPCPFESQFKPKPDLFHCESSADDPV